MILAALTGDGEVGSDDRDNGCGDGTIGKDPLPDSQVRASVFSARTTLLIDGNCCCPRGPARPSLSFPPLRRHELFHTESQRRDVAAHIPSFASRQRSLALIRVYSDMYNERRLILLCDGTLPNFCCLTGLSLRQS